MRNCDMQEQLTPDFGDYELIDSGDFEKLERFGNLVTRRPEPQAIWRRSRCVVRARRASRRTRRVAHEAADADALDGGVPS